MQAVPHNFYVHRVKRRGSIGHSYGYFARVLSFLQAVKSVPTDKRATTAIPEVFTMYFIIQNCFMVVKQQLCRANNLLITNWLI